MDKYGNKYFENLEEELPRKNTHALDEGRMLPVTKKRLCLTASHSANSLGRLQGQGV
jgi:hypothetical protein